MTNSDFEKIKKAIIKRHLDQLRPHELVEAPLGHYPIYPNYDDLVIWTNDSQTQINQGISNQVYGGAAGPINFNNAFMAFMESAAVYMRDTPLVIKAVNLYRSGGNDDNAINLMVNSTQQISDLRHPDGHSLMVGPFCGAFIPKDYKTSSKPFMGIAYKGTNPLSREVLNDLWAVITVHAKGYVWDSQVAEGFYYPLISTYEQTASLMPYSMVRQAIQDIATVSKNNVILHVTGHSLGGAYATLTYGQLSIDGPGTTKAVLGDIYTFGSPRVGRGDFAKPFKAAIDAAEKCSGSSWRIMNTKDIVPKVPASLPRPLTWDPFIHVDSAYKIYPDQAPKAQPSEIGTHPTWPLPIFSIWAHIPTEYYKSLTYATTQNSPLHSVTTWGRLPLPAYTIPSPDVQSKPFWDHETNADSFILENRGEYVVGALQYGSIIGEITALGKVKVNLVSSKIFNFDSTEKLLDKENQVVFKKEANSQLGLYFVVDGTLVAYASVLTEGLKHHDVTDESITRGMCIWSFNETSNVLEIENAVANDIERLLTIT